LSYLKRWRVDYLKIDRSFVRYLTGAALDLTEEHERELADFGATTGNLRAVHN
jgi:EAL domain-containing protein (putative c-di-GMP-specific phosphodiesterase class I)